jgi:hypothetical protein
MNGEFKYEDSAIRPAQWNMNLTSVQLATSDGEKLATVGS